MQSSKTHLFDLPFDILDLILVKLSEYDVQSLARTCKYFKRMVELHFEKEDARRLSEKRRMIYDDYDYDLDDEYCGIDFMAFGDNSDSD